MQPIKIAPSQAGSLHRLLGVSQSAKIPANKLAIKSGDSAAVRKKKQFAKNARSWNHAPATGKLLGK